MAGPEVGQIFFGPTAPAGAYSNWNGGEPNNVSEEDAASLHSAGPNWNDLPVGLHHTGYYVEYSPVAVGVPEPGTWALMILGFGATGAMMRRRRPILA